MTLDEYLVQIQRFDGNDNYKRPKKDFLDKLQGLSDEQLEQETEQKIWLSAYAANNRRSDYHWQCDACYIECQRRGLPAIYERAYAKASKGAS